MCIALTNVILRTWLCVCAWEYTETVHTCHTSLSPSGQKYVHVHMYVHVPNFPRPIFREIRILSKLKHKNVIRLVEVFEDEEKQKMYVVLEYCVGGLQELLERCSLHKFPLQQAHRWGRGEEGEGREQCQHVAVAGILCTYVHAHAHIHIRMHANIHTCTQ